MVGLLLTIEISKFLKYKTTANFWIHIILAVEASTQMDMKKIALYSSLRYLIEYAICIESALNAV